MFRQKVFQLLTLLLAVPLISCGGGSVELSYDGPTINAPDFTPVSQSPTAVFSIGPVTAQSSLTVNSVVYDTDTATVRINGEPGVVGDLRTGYVVTVSGMLDTGWKSGSAERISYDAYVTGPVEGADPERRSLSVMGQNVRIDTDTRFEHPLDFDSLFSLASGTPVQVSGLPNVGGEIVATHIQIVTNWENAQVIGEASDVDHDLMTFRINGLNIDYSSALIIDLPGGTLNQGMVVIARGSLDSNGKLLVAELRSHLDRSELATGTLVQLTGYLMRYNPGTRLFVNSLGIETEFHTIFHNGLLRDLTPGIKVEIDGRWGIGNSVIAEQLWFLD